MSLFIYVQPMISNGNTTSTRDFPARLDPILFPTFKLSLSLSHSPFFFRRSHPQTYHIWWLCCQHWSLDPSCFWVSILIPIHSSISLFFFLVLWWFLHQGFVGCAVFFPFNFPFLSLIIFQGKFVIQPAF